MAGVLAPVRDPQTVNEALLATPVRPADPSRLSDLYDGDPID